MNKVEERIREIRLKKEEYRRNLEKYEKEVEERKTEYNMAVRDLCLPIKECILENLNKFDLLKFRIDVSPSWYDSDTVRVFIECNPIGNTLRWDFDIYREDGTLNVKSNSWSGMNVSTVDDVKTIKQSAEAMEYIVTEDWENTIDVKMPVYTSFFEGMSARPVCEDFDIELFDLMIESIMGTDKVLKLEDLRATNKNRYSSNIIYVKAYRTTNKSYELGAVPESSLKKDYDYDTLSKWFDASRTMIRKDKLKMIDPVDIIDLNDFRCEA